MRLLMCAAVVGVAGLVFGADSEWRPESGFRDKGRQVTRLIARAEKAQAGGRFKKAIKAYAKIERLSVNLRNRARAVVRQGDCLMAMDKPWTAYERYHKALDEYAGFVDFDAVVQRESDIAEEFFGGRTDRFLFFDLSTEHMAMEIYDHVVKVAPYSPLAPRALYRSALLSTRARDYDEAIRKLKDVRRDYGGSEVADAAQLALAKALLASAQEGDGDGLRVSEARRELDRLIERQAGGDELQATATRLRQEAAEIEARRLLELGVFYQRQAHERKPAARRYLREAVADYPGTPSAAAAEEMLASLDGATAAVSPAPRTPAVQASTSAPRSPTTSPKAQPPRPKRPVSDKWLLPVEDLEEPENDQK